MEQVEREAVLGAGGAVGHGEPTGRAVDGGHLGVQPDLDAVTLGDAFQGPAPDRYAEHGVGGRPRTTRIRSRNPLPAPVVGGRIGDLVRGAATFHRAARLGEDRGARAQATDEFQVYGAYSKAWSAGYGTVPDGGAEAGDRVPVQLETGCHHEVVVADGAVRRGDGPRLGVDSGGGLADPVHLPGHDGGFGAVGDTEWGPAAADQGPQRLIPVDVGRFEHRDVADRHAAGGPRR